MSHEDLVAGLAVVSGDAAGLPPLSLPVWACRLDLDPSDLRLDTSQTAGLNAIIQFL